MRREAGGAVVQEFERLLEPGTVAGLTEDQVVARFVEAGDPVAFEAIIRRHGPMVFSLCRHLLRDANDVDDAFQATFLILVKKASTLRQPERIGPWLYGVASRVARRARTQPRPPAVVDDRPAVTTGCPVEERETLEAIHDEIGHLPEKYRLPVVLCFLEGLSHDEAARQLGWPVGTVSGRLSRARERLKSRLARRKITAPPTGVLVWDMLEPARNALPESITRLTVARLTGAVPAHLQNLVKGALTAMFITKLRTIGLSLLVALTGAVAATSAVLAYQDRPAPEAGIAQESVTAQTNTPRRDDSVTQKKPARAADAPAAQAAERESRFEELDRLQTKAQLLELDVEQELIRISNQRQLLAQLQNNPVSDVDVPTDQLEKLQQQYERNMKKTALALEKAVADYERDRIQLGKLKRQIERTAESLGESAEPADSVASLAKRLERLEQKVDSIIETLGTKKARARLPQ
jgi:RNA polymerase sigma factor (sigma-70 family)